MAGPRPAVVWADWPAGEEPRAAVSDLLGVRRQSARGPQGSPTGEIGGRNVLGLAGRKPASGGVLHPGHGPGCGGA